MARICLGAERQFEADTDFEAAPRGLERADQAIAMAAMFLTEHIGIGAIVAMTESGGTPRYLSRFRSRAPIYAFARDAGARRRMAMMRDVIPIGYDSRGQTPREAARGSIRTLVEAGWLEPGDRVVFTSGEHMETRGATNTLRLLQVGHVRQLRLLGLQPQRLGSLPGGLALMLAAFKVFGVERMAPSEPGLRLGVLHGLMSQRLN